MVRELSTFAWMLVLAAAAVLPAEAQEAELAQHYGFLPLEVFKLEQRSGNMLAGDLNKDGLTDLVLVDNSHSRIDLLQQRKTEPGETAAEAATASVNSVSDHWRFEHRKIGVDHEIVSLVLGDFNADGRTDIVYLGSPDQLIFRFQPEEGDWTERTEIRLPDVQPVPWLIAAGDLNGNGRDDLVVLGRYETYVLYQQAPGEFGQPRRLLNTSEKLGVAQIADLDGDGRNDLCYLAGEGQNRAFCARLQLPGGQLSPEYVFSLEQPRALSVRNIDGADGHELLTVDSRTGRIKLLQLKQAEEPQELPKRLTQYGFGRKGTGKTRDLTIADLDGDGLPDVIATDPDASRMIVFRQTKGGGLDLGTQYPGLVGAEHVRAADFDGDKSAEVIVLSSTERTIGISRFTEGRLTFPQALPVENEPVALELADLDGDGALEIVYVARVRSGRDSSYSLQALERTKEGTWQPRKFGEKSSLPLTPAGTPERLLRLDANQDGRPDFLVFVGLNRPPHLLTTDEQGTPGETTSRGSFGLGAVAAGAIFSGQLDAPALLVAQENFARNLQLSPEGQWQVLDQYNTAESSARVAGAVTLDLDGRPGNEIVLIDTGVRKLRILRQEENVFRPWKEIEIGDFPYLAAHVADLNGDGRDDLLLFGADKFAVLYVGGSSPELKELASFESKLKDVYPADVTAGDLNGDGAADLAMIDTRSHFIEVLRYAPAIGLVHALYFRLFEEKSFTAAEGTGSEPRESLVADVTGDGLADLVLLAHDRVLLYPQDPGEAAEDAEATGGE